MGSSDEEDLKEIVSKPVRHMQLDADTMLPGGGVNPFVQGATVAVPQLEDMRARLTADADHP